jgi:hypothetical protein
MRKIDLGIRRSWCCGVQAIGFELVLAG